MRLIDADALLDRIPNLYERREVSRWVDEAPSVDAVPVVRCGECEYYHPAYCEIWSRFGTVQTRPNGFCYMAERKDGKDGDADAAD